MSLFVILQTFYYPRDRDQRLSLYNRAVTSIYGLIILANVVSVFVLDQKHLIDFMYVLALFKLYLSFAKYVPQVSPAPPLYIKFLTPTLLTGLS